MPFSYLPDSFSSHNPEIAHHQQTYLAFCKRYGTGTLPLCDDFEELISALTDSSTNAASILLSQTHTLYSMVLVLAGSLDKARFHLAKAEPCISDTSHWNQILFHTSHMFASPRHDRQVAEKHFGNAKHLVETSPSYQQTLALALEFNLAAMWYFILQMDYEKATIHMQSALKHSYHSDIALLSKTSRLVGCLYFLFPEAFLSHEQSLQLLTASFSKNVDQLKNAIMMQLASATLPSLSKTFISASQHLPLMPDISENFIQKLLMHTGTYVKYMKTRREHVKSEALSPTSVYVALTVLEEQVRNFLSHIATDHTASLLYLIPLQDQHLVSLIYLQLSYYTKAREHRETELTETTRTALLHSLLNHYFMRSYFSTLSLPQILDTFSQELRHSPSPYRELIIKEINTLGNIPVFPDYPSDTHNAYLIGLLNLLSYEAKEEGYISTLRALTLRASKWAKEQSAQGNGRRIPYFKIMFIKILAAITQLPTETPEEIAKHILLSLKEMEAMLTGTNALVFTQNTTSPADAIETFIQTFLRVIDCFIALPKETVMPHLPLVLSHTKSITHILEEPKGTFKTLLKASKTDSLSSLKSYLSHLSALAYDTPLPLEDNVTALITTAKEAYFTPLLIQTLQLHLARTITLLESPTPKLLASVNTLPKTFEKARESFGAIKDKLLYTLNIPAAQRNSAAEQLARLAYLMKEYQKAIEKGAVHADALKLHLSEASYTKEPLSLLTLLIHEINSLYENRIWLKEREASRLTPVIDAFKEWPEGQPYHPWLAASITILEGITLFYDVMQISEPKEKLLQLLMPLKDQLPSGVPSNFTKLFGFLQQLQAASLEDWISPLLHNIENAFMSSASSLTQLLCHDITDTPQIQETITLLQNLYAKRKHVIEKATEYRLLGKEEESYHFNTECYQAILHSLEGQRFTKKPHLDAKTYEQSLRQLEQYHKSMSIVLLSNANDDIQELLSTYMTSFYLQYLQFLLHPVTYRKDFSAPIEQFSSVMTYVVALEKFMPKINEIGDSLRTIAVILATALTSQKQHHVALQPMLLRFVGTPHIWKTLLNVKEQEKKHSSFLDILLLALSYAEYLHHKNDPALVALLTQLKEAIPASISPFIRASLLSFSTHPLTEDNTSEFLTLTEQFLLNPDASPLQINSFPVLREKQATHATRLAPACYLYSIRDRLLTTHRQHNEIHNTRIPTLLLELYDRLFTYRITQPGNGIDSKELISSCLDFFIQEAPLLLSPSQQDAFLSSLPKLLNKMHTALGKEPMKAWKTLLDEKLSGCFPKEFSGIERPLPSIMVLLIEHLAGHLPLSLDVSLKPFFNEAKLKAEFLFSTHTYWLTYQTNTHNSSMLDKGSHASSELSTTLLAYLRLLDACNKDPLKILYLSDANRALLDKAAPLLAASYPHFAPYVSEIKTWQQLYVERDKFFAETKEVYKGTFAYPKASKQERETLLKKHPSLQGLADYTDLVRFITNNDLRGTLKLTYATDLTALEASITQHLSYWSSFVPEIHSFIKETYLPFIALGKARTGYFLETPSCDASTLTHAFTVALQLPLTPSLSKQLTQCFDSITVYTKSRELLSRCNAATDAKDWDTLYSAINSSDTLVPDPFKASYQLLLDAKDIDISSSFLNISSILQRLSKWALPEMPLFSRYVPSLTKAMNAHKIRLEEAFLPHKNWRNLLHDCEKALQTPKTLAAHIKALEELEPVSEEYTTLLEGYRLCAEEAGIKNQPLANQELYYFRLKEWSAPVMLDAKKQTSTLESKITKLKKSLEQDYAQVTLLAAFKEAAIACNNAIDQEQLSNAITAFPSAPLPENYQALKEGYTQLSLSYSAGISLTSRFLDQLERWKVPVLPEDFALLVAFLHQAIKAQMHSLQTTLTVQKGLQRCHQALEKQDLQQLRIQLDILSSLPCEDAAYKQLLEGYRLAAVPKDDSRFTAHYERFKTWNAEHAPLQKQIALIKETLAKQALLCEAEYTQHITLMDLKNTVSVCDQALHLRDVKKLKAAIASFPSDAFPENILSLMQGYRLLLHSHNVTILDAPLLLEHFTHWNPPSLPHDLAVFLPRLQQEMAVQITALKECIADDLQVQKDLALCDEALASNDFALLKTRLQALPTHLEREACKQLASLYTQILSVYLPSAPIAIKHLPTLRHKLSVPQIDAPSFLEAAVTRAEEVLYNARRIYDALITWHDALSRLHQKTESLFIQKVDDPRNRNKEAVDQNKAGKNHKTVADISVLNDAIHTLKDDSPLSVYFRTLLTLHKWQQYGPDTSYTLAKDLITTLPLLSLPMPDEVLSEFTLLPDCTFTLDSNLLAWLAIFLPPPVRETYGLPLPKGVAMDIPTRAKHAALSWPTIFALQSVMENMQPLLKKEAWEQIVLLLEDAKQQPLLTSHPLLRFLTRFASYKHALTQGIFATTRLDETLTGLYTDLEKINRYAEIHYQSVLLNYWLMPFTVKVDSLSNLYTKYIASFPTEALVPGIYALPTWMAYLTHIEELVKEIGKDPSSTSLIDFVTLRIKWESYLISPHLQQKYRDSSEEFYLKQINTLEIRLDNTASNKPLEITLLLQKSLQHMRSTVEHYFRTIITYRPLNKEAAPFVPSHLSASIQACLEESSNDNNNATALPAFSPLSLAGKIQLLLEAEAWEAIIHTLQPVTKAQENLLLELEIPEDILSSFMVAEEDPSIACNPVFSLAKQYAYYRYQLETTCDKRLINSALQSLLPLLEKAEHFGTEKELVSLRDTLIGMVHVLKKDFDSLICFLPDAFSGNWKDYFARVSLMPDTPMRASLLTYASLHIHFERVTKGHAKDPLEFKKFKPQLESFMPEGLPLEMSLLVQQSLALFKQEVDSYALCNIPFKKSFASSVQPLTPDKSLKPKTRSPNAFKNPSPEKKELSPSAVTQNKSSSSQQL